MWPSCESEGGGRVKQRGDCLQEGRSKERNEAQQGRARKEKGEEGGRASRKVVVVVVTGDEVVEQNVELNGSNGCRATDMVITELVTSIRSPLNPHHSTSTQLTRATNR